MRTIYKYPVPVDNCTHTHEMPTGSDIKFVSQQGCPCIWAEVQTDAPKVRRRFRIFGTGHPIPDDFVYRGTALDVPFVWHVYELC